MTTKTFTFSDGGKLSVEYEGTGSGKATFTPEKNEGVDREMDVTFIDESRAVSVKKKVCQDGLRQAFMGADGEFRGASDEVFAVYKEGKKP